MDFNNTPSVDVKVRELSLSIKPEVTICHKLHLRKQLATEKQILQNVSFDVPAGSLMAIIGESGSGKVINKIPGNYLPHRLHY
jgi:ABC-type glutathione transport system ATPase component